MHRLPSWILLTTCWCAAVASDVPQPRPVDVAALVRRLGSEDFAEREQASRRLGSLSVDEPPHELIDALNSDNPEVRDRAKRAVIDLKEHIVRQRDRAALARLPREERFAKRGQVDLYVASTATTRWRADNDRLWLPALGISRTAATKAGLKGGYLPGGPLLVEDFASYRLKGIHNNLIQTDEVFTRERRDNFMFRGGVMAPGVDSQKTMEAFVVSRGTVRVRRSLNNSLVLATGDVIVRAMCRSTVICDGDVIVDGMSSCFVIARGNVMVNGSSQENTVFAGGTVTLKNPLIQTQPSKLQLDAEDRVLMKTNHPLGFITFFELSTVGVEAKAADKAVQVTAVADDKSFANAGVRVGDIIAEVNGKKPGSAESLRRLLRDALAIGDATVKLQRGERVETVKVSLPE